MHFEYFSIRIFWVRIQQSSQVSDHVPIFCLLHLSCTRGILPLVDTFVFGYLPLPVKLCHSGVTLRTLVFKFSLVAQSCPTLCDPMDYSLPGSSVHGIFQARVLEWVAISFSRRSSQPRDRTQVSHIVGRHFIIWATGEVLRTLGVVFISHGKH